jgi:tetratricopeptide (TPR) repeat protein
LADARLKLLDNDSDAINMKMEIEANRGDFAAAHTWGEKLLSLGQENGEMLNNLAWESLFTGKVTDDDIATAVKATQLQKDAPDILHTLACLYAETGKTKEAHDLLLRAMDDWNLDEPNDEVWYVLGRIAESTASGTSPSPTTTSCRNRRRSSPYPRQPGDWRRCG